MKNPFLPPDLSSASDHAVLQSIEHYRELSKRLSRVANPHADSYQSNVTEALTVFEAELEKRRKCKHNPAADWFQIYR